MPFQEANLEINWKTRTELDGVSRVPCLSDWVDIYVFGIQRSGNHGIINWLLGQFDHLDPEQNLMKRGVFFNHFNAARKRPEIVPLEPRADKVRLVSYENDARLFDEEFRDKLLEEDENLKKHCFVIIRHPLNWYASFKALSESNKWRKLTPRLDVVDLMLDYFENFALNKKDSRVIPILFDRWFSNKKYRDEIALNLVSNPNDRGFRVMGSGSSFEGWKSKRDVPNLGVLERWRLIDDREMAELKSNKRIERMVSFFGGDLKRCVFQPAKVMANWRTEISLDREMMRSEIRLGDKNAKVKLVSFFMDNIPREVLEAQAKVVKKFGYEIEQVRFEDSHQEAIDRFISDTDWEHEFLIILDVDAIPVSHGAIPYMVSMLKEGYLVGCAQAANHMKRSHVYVGPFCMGLTKRIFNDLGKPSFGKTKRSDVGQELTYQAEDRKLPVSMMMPVKVEDPCWNLGNWGKFGKGTTYGVDGVELFWHSFESRHQTKRFLAKCEEISQDDLSKIVVFGPVHAGLGDKLCALSAIRKYAYANPQKKVYFDDIHRVIKAFDDGVVVEGRPNEHEEEIIKRSLTDIGPRFRVKGKSPDLNLVGCFMSHLGLKPDGMAPELPKFTTPKGVKRNGYVTIQPKSKWAKNPSESFVQSLVGSIKDRFGLPVIAVGKKNTARFLKDVDYSFLSDDVLQMMALVEHSKFHLCPRSATAHVAASYGVRSIVWDPGDGETWHISYEGWDCRVLRNEVVFHDLFSSSPFLSQRKKAIYRIDPSNVGDRFSSPVKWFDLGTFDQFDVTSETARYDGGLAVVGGGGLLHFNNLRKIVGKNAVVWGAGMNNHSKREDDVPPSWLNECKMVGLRDHVKGWRWVPCPSCMSNVFDKQYEIKHKAVIYQHKYHHIGIENLPKMKNNVKTIHEAVSFMGSGETVITNSYHGMYWATLLGRRVIVYKPFSSRFFFSRFKPAFLEDNKWDETTPICYPEALKMCREANRAFYQDLLFRFNVHIPLSKSSPSIFNSITSPEKENTTD